MTTYFSSPTYFVRYDSMMVCGGGEPISSEDSLNAVTNRSPPSSGSWLPPGRPIVRGFLQVGALFSNKHSPWHLQARLGIDVIDTLSMHTIRIELVYFSYTSSNPAPIFFGCSEEVMVFASTGAHADVLVLFSSIFTINLDWKKWGFEGVLLLAVFDSVFKSKSKQNSL